MQIKEFLAASVVLFCMIFAVGTQAEEPLKVLQNPDRTKEDRQRDITSKPETVIPLLNLKPGAIVADIFAGSGYYSEIIAAEVGPKGKVYLQNNDAYIKFAQKALAARMPHLPDNVVRLDSETDDLKLPVNGLDAAVIIMSYHDIYYTEAEHGWGPHDRNKFLQQIHTALKPGGRFVIVDHSAAKGKGIEDCKSLHRIEKSRAIKDIEQAGFKLVAQTDSLANPDDDLSLSVFDKKIRHHTDRFVVAFEKQ